MIGLVLLQLASIDAQVLSVPCSIENGEVYGYFVHRRPEGRFTWNPERCNWSEDADRLAESLLGSFVNAERAYSVSILPSFALPEHHVIYVEHRTQEAILVSLFLRASVTRLGRTETFDTPQIIALSRPLSVNEFDGISRSAQTVSVCNASSNEIVNQDAVSWTYGTWISNTHCSVELYDPTGPFAAFGETVAEFGNGLLDSYVSNLMDAE